MKKISEEQFELSTGKVIYPNCGIIGLSENETEGFTISEGYDSSWVYATAEDHNDSLDLTQDEAKEVAEYMVKMWTEFALSLE